MTSNMQQFVDWLDGGWEERWRGMPRNWRRAVTNATNGISTSGPAGSH